MPSLLLRTYLIALAVGAPRLVAAPAHAVSFGAAPAAVEASPAQSVEQEVQQEVEQNVEQSDRRARVPYAPGERMTYDVKFGSLKVGSGSMEVSGVDTIRGREAFRTEFRVKASALLYKVNDVMRSWIDTHSLSSLRFIQDYDQTGGDRKKRYEIFPERGTYQEPGQPEKPSVPQPLDDASFLYFVRSMPLTVGETYTLQRYFKPDRNPVTIKVLRRERVKVPAGSFDAIVIQPIIKTSGIFSENGRAEIWLTDDSSRVMVQMKSQLSFGSLNLYLRSMKPGTQLADRVR